MELTLEPITPEEEPQLSLNTSTNAPNPVQGEVARNRAMKMDIAVGEDSPGVESIQNSIQTGQEPYIRQLLTQSTDKAKLERLKEKIANLAATGQGASKEASDAVQLLRNPYSSNPNTELEKNFADKYLENVLRSNPAPDSIVAQAVQDAPEEAKAAVIGFQSVVARREMIRKVYEDAAQQYSNQSYLGWGYNVVRGMVPGVSAATTSPDWSLKNIIFPGSSLEEQRDTLWGFQDINESEVWLKSRVAEIAKSSPNDAVAFAKSMVDFPSSEKFTQNVMGMVDTQNVGGVITGLGKAAISMKAMRGLLRSSLDGIAEDGALRADNIKAAVGDIKGAADARATREVFKAIDPTGKTVDLTEKIPTFMNPKLIEGIGAPDLVRERASRIVPILQKNSSDLLAATSMGTRAPRIPEQAMKAGLEEANELIRHQYPSVNDAILDRRSIYTPATGTTAEEVIIGKRDGTIFRSAAQADNYAQREYGLDFQSYKISSEVPENLKSKIPPKVLKNAPVDSNPIPTKFRTGDTTLPDKGTNQNFANWFLKGDKPLFTAATPEGLAKVLDKASLEALGKHNTISGKYTDGSPYTIWYKDGASKAAKELDALYTKGSAGMSDEAWRRKQGELLGFPKDKIDAFVGQTAKPTGFKTAKGSEYVINPDGTTTRNKAARPEHPGDAGPKPKSLKTVYLTEEQASALGPPQGHWRIADHGDGTLSTITRYEGKPWGVSPSAKNIPYSTTPAKGLIPLELWKSAKTNGVDAFREAHFGNKITEFTGVAAPTVSPKQAELNKIVQQGNGYYISITKDVNETGPASKQLLLPTTNVNPQSVGNWFLGGIARSAEDQLSYFQREGRHLVTHVPQAVQKVMVEKAQLIGTLRKDSHEALERVLINNRDYVDHATGVRGRAYSNQSQMEKAWLDINNRLPTDKESLAYWTYHQLMDVDWVMRNFGVHRDLARQGMENFTLSSGDKSTSLSGRYQKDVPWEAHTDFGVQVLHQDGTSAHYWRSKMSDDVAESLKNLIHEEGYKVIQVGNPGDRPLRALTDKGSSVHFVLTKDFKSAPLGMNLVDYSPGVHVIYPQQHFVKVPDIAIGENGRKILYGEKTIFAVDTEKEAIRISSAVNEVGKMIRNKATDTELNAFIEKHLPEDATYWKGKFDSYIGHEYPVGNTFSGKSYFDTHPKIDNLYNERTSEFNLYRSVDMDFLANRDGPLMTMTNKGSYEQPMYKFETARVMDPFVSINRGLGNAIRNLYLNDSKVSAIEQWTAQYAHLMKDPQRAAANPFETFYGMPLNEAHTDRMALASAKNTHERIVQFIGTRTELGRDLNLVQQKLMNKLGEGGARWYSDHELYSLKDPIAFTRAAMFDFRFGMFNPAQYVVQSMGFAHVLGVTGPIAAGKAMAAHVVQRLMAKTGNPEVQNRLANIATKFGWTKENFIEASTTMKNLGFDIIGKEHSLRDGAFDPTLFQSTAGKVLEWGRGFFKAGERLTRETSWFAAYAEWRKLNPTKELSQFEVGKILRRADDLGLNMTRASHSYLQEGVFAVPTQFYTFSHRMMEQMWGGRLSGAEKLRAFATHSALFGVPVATAAAYPWPFWESLRQEQLEEGNPIIDNKWHELAANGFLSFVVHHATGTDYNIESRYGPGFSDTLKKLADGDSTFREIAFGPAGTFVGSILKSTYPFYVNIRQGLTGGQEAFPITKEDFMGVVREVSSANNLHNAFYALNAGKYFSKSGSLVANDMTAKDAAAMVLSLTRRDITDTRLMMGSLKDQADAQKKVSVIAEREFRRAWEYGGADDWQKAEVHLTRAKTLMTAIGDFSDKQMMETLDRSYDSQAMKERVMLQFTKKGYASKLPAKLQRLFDTK